MNYIASILAKKRDLAKNEMEYEKSILFDVYTFVLVFLLLCNVVINILLFRPVNCIIFGSFTIFMLGTLFWPDRIRFNPKLLMLLFFFLGIMIFYFDTISGEGCMNYLSYVSLTIAVAFFFDYIRDRWIIFFLILSYLLWFLINVTTDYYLSRFYDQNLSPIEEWYVRIYKIIEISFCTFVGMYFIYRKERFLVKYYIEKEKLNAMIQKTDKINFSGELYELAMSKNSLFITYFKSQFPDFFDNILGATPNLISSELEICALLKLNLSTKEIAIATNSTVKAIENKKYRIRRKLDLSTETDINLYIINNF
ncbi:helix-turn-helix transcriptional regulator [Epilithonimonas zeae]|uniref:HTH luxR-type domain-containing protein n=1 Tax=Epilithonimonas zeae TaxID=1416779 RepID=A0A1N6DU73_9FLAO|nr:hypothetical protein [Epilithonimonas zeae]SIN74332.1 hypothetical protein SAMN05444409_0054 [Epilithonimonas zeae]